MDPYRVQLTLYSFLYTSAIQHMLKLTRIVMLYFEAEHLYLKHAKRHI